MEPGLLGTRLAPSSCFFMSGKSTNPAVYVLPFIWITFIFLTAVAADCQRSRCKTQKIQGFWQMADRRKLSDRMRPFRGGFRETHKSFRGQKSSNSQSNPRREENFKSLLSRSKGFSKENLQNFFLRFKPKQPRKTKVDAERRDQNLFTKRRPGSKKILPTRFFG